MSTRVLFQWMEPNAGGSQSKQWEWLPECPAVGATVYIRTESPDQRGYSDPESSKAMTVRSVSWTCDGTPFWHAEVYLQ